MRMRATVAGLTSRAAPMAASVQLGPASPWLAFSRMRAWVSALAGATPRPIMVCSQARSSSVRTTTCRLRTSASCSVGPPEPHEDEGQPPTTQLKADELLVADGTSCDGTIEAVDSDYLEIAEHDLGEARRRGAVRARRFIGFV